MHVIRAVMREANAAPTTAESKMRALLIPLVVCVGGMLPAVVDVPAAQAIVDSSYVSSTATDDCFPLAVNGVAAPLWASSNDYPGVLRAVRDIQADLRRVVGTPPEFQEDGDEPGQYVVMIGTLGKSALIDRLVETGKFNAAELADSWEQFVTQVVDDPLPGVEKALVIAGSDKRGTIYGVYDLSAQIGVSPWYWWADVPAAPQPDLFVLPGRHTNGKPAVKYRGIFINDEAPALSGWAHEKFGGFNHEFYEHVFELILRLKGNYLWPAMWGRSLFDDDPKTAQLANEYGIVIGTSHHEPMMRAHVEWQRYGDGPWNYESNGPALRAFWKEGVERMGARESIVTIGMRGDGDEPMSEEADIALLERIVADQRRIIADVTEAPAAETPQLWALYKEVQEYYDKGMRVPDDVTLLLCDDNWGNLRKLPSPQAPPRAGGYGVYYHFDYVGGPRNYKWLNVTQISRVWEQLRLAYEHGVQRIWIVNVGDIKPMEFPTQFFLDFAWNPSAWPAERLDEYSRKWAEQQFGPDHAAEIAGVLSDYTRFNSRRTPELLSPDTYSLLHFQEAETVVAQYNDLAARAEQIGASLRADQQDAFFQFVLYPVRASANLNELYVTAAKNRLYARQGRSATNRLATEARRLFATDTELTRQFHEDVADGKWNHMMSQTHIGYTSWQEPDQNIMPAVVEIDVPHEAAPAIAVEGSAEVWTADDGAAKLPPLSSRAHKSRYFELFNRGSAPFDFTIEAATPWIQVNPAAGSVEDQCRVTLSVAWHQAPAGRHRVPISIRAAGGETISAIATVDNRAAQSDREIVGYVEVDGYVSIEAEHYAKAVDAPPVRWQVIPGLGRTLSGVTTLPSTAPSTSSFDEAAPRLTYQIDLVSAGEVEVRAYLSPSLDFRGREGLRYGISFDEQRPQIVNMHGDWSHQGWQRAVSDNVVVSVSRRLVNQAGSHKLNFWRVDPGVVLQKLVIVTGDGVGSTYLGPPESPCRPASIDID